jgi:hypothetical protein
LEKYIKKDISSYKAQWHLINILWKLIPLIK